MNKLHIGTCSWKYKSWEHLVYTDSNPDNYLKEYSTKYNTVEIDQWFWSLFSVDKVILPDIKVVKEYVQSVPDDFTFTIKVPNSITLTHFYNKDNAGNLVANPYFLNVDMFNRFFDSVSPMLDKCGALMFQFEYLNKQKLGGLSEFENKFGSFISQIPKGINYAVEIRNPNYLTNQYFEFLSKNNLIPVLLHGYYMPPIWETVNKFSKYLTSDLVIRLHGYERKGIEKVTNKEWNTVVFNQDSEIPKIVESLMFLSKTNNNIYVNVNNHYEGSAPITIEKIIELLSSHIQ